MAALSGVFPASVTPFAEGGGQMDLDWIAGHLAYLERRGADGVLALGTNGEGPSLTLAERRQVTDTVLRHKGGLAVMIGSGCAALTDTIEASSYALERGADAVLIVPPFYFKTVSPEGLNAYYDAVFAALPSGRRVFLYNIPSFSGVEITTALVDHLLDRFPDKLAGVKDTSGSPESLRRFITRYPGLTVFTGSDGLAGEGYRLGGAGSISGVANVFPDLIAAPGKVRSEEERKEAQAVIDRVRALIKDYPAPSVIKHLLRIVAGLPQTYVRPPLRDLTPAEAADLERKVNEMGLQ